jgi:pimeloyl-ACP methyl ester carboxylesterase
MGVYHRPEPELALGAGVVLCNPLGYEGMCAYRTYRHLATRLATAGFDVLRFDYLGTGDSSGRDDEPSRVRAWLDSILAAVDELRAIGGVHTVDLFGVRLGATLAALAAEERRDIRCLVLWAPFISGRAYAREARALRMLKQNDSGLAPERGRGDGDASEPTTPSDLAAVNLLALRDRFVARTLVLPREDLPTGQKDLALHLQSCGIETDLRAGVGYARMMDHPETAVVPSATLDYVVAWLRRGNAGVVLRRRPDLDRSRVLTAWSHDPCRLVREEALMFGDGSRLFGVLTEPQEPVSARCAVMFINAGANHRVGPNRLYVSLARDLAARGYQAFRFDVGGLGDGGPAPGMTENRVYSKDSIADVKTAMTFLTRIRGVKRFALVGICSGGFLAFHTSADDARVAGQIVINPQTFEWKPGDSMELSARKSYKSTRYYLRAIRNLSVWTHALRGELDVRGVARTLRSRSTARAAVRLKSLIARCRGLRGPRTEVERVFRALSERGVRSLLIFSSNDGGLDMIEEHLGSEASSMQGHTNFRLEIVDGADHTFTQPDAQHQLTTLITRFVEASWPTRSTLLDEVRA